MPLHRLPGRGALRDLAQAAGQAAAAARRACRRPAWLGPTAWPHAVTDRPRTGVRRALDRQVASGSTRPSAWTTPRGRRRPRRRPRTRRWRAAPAAPARAWFAERFVEGREFNLSLLDGPDGPDGAAAGRDPLRRTSPTDKPRIVGYAAKWDEDSFEYRHTSRRFDLPAGDAAAGRRSCGARAGLLDGCFGCAAGRASISASTAQGRPWILEVNANPCLSPGRRLRRRAHAYGHRVHPRDRAGPGRRAELGFGFTVQRSRLRPNP